MISIFASPISERVIELPVPIGRSRLVARTFCIKFIDQLIKFFKNAILETEKDFVLLNSTVHLELASALCSSIQWLVQHQRLQNELRECARRFKMDSPIGNVRVRALLGVCTASTQLSKTLKNTTTKLVYGFVASFIKNTLHHHYQTKPFLLSFTISDRVHLTLKSVNSSQDQVDWVQLISRLTVC